MKKNNEKFSGGPSEIGPGREDLVRRGAREVIQQAIDAELARLLEHYSNVKTLAGSRAVVRNGYLPEREILTAVGPASVKVPKVRDRSKSGGDKSRDCVLEVGRQYFTCADRLIPPAGSHPTRSFNSTRRRIQPDAPAGGGAGRALLREAPATGEPRQDRDRRRPYRPAPSTFTLPPSPVTLISGPPWLSRRVA